MVFPKKFLCFIIGYLVVSILVTGGFSTYAHAGLATVEMFENFAGSDISKIEAVLEKKIISQRLKDIGVSPDAIKAKLNNLSDEQLHNIAAHIDSLYAGGSEGLTLIVSLLLIVLITVVSLQLTGHKVIVTKR